MIADTEEPVLGIDFLYETGLIIHPRKQTLIDPISFVSIPLCRMNVEQQNSYIRSQRVLFDLPKEITTLLSKFPDLTSPINVNSPTKHKVQHCIITKGRLALSKFRRLNPKKLKVAKFCFDSLLQMGIIRRSSSSVSSPLHMAPKKEPGDWRPCGDYRLLNQVTLPDLYPLPHIQDLTAFLKGKKIFSKVDLMKGYNQIPMHPDDVFKTAVTTPFGLFEWVQMPFGLKCAGQTFQRLMDEVLHGVNGSFGFVDDILIASDSAEAHLNDIEMLFQRLDSYGMRINLSKCEFGKVELDFLGHHITPNGITPKDDNIKAILNFELPRTVKDLQRFLGMAQFYQRFVPHFATLCASFYDRISASSSSQNIDWSGEMKVEFEKIKSAIANYSKLHHPSPGLKLQLAADASSTAVGAVLHQVTEDGELQPLGFFSKKLTKTEIRYSTFDRELLAIFLAVRHFRHILEGNSDVTVLTDHKPLAGALSRKTSTSSTPRQERQLAFIAEFVDQILHIQGKENVVADTLSRGRFSPNDERQAVITSIHLSANELISAQHEDAGLQEFLKEHPQEWLAVSVDGSNQVIACEVSGVNPRPFLPERLRKKVFEQLHHHSHPGVKATVKLITQRYYWPDMKRQVTAWTRECLHCQSSKITRHTISPHQAISTPSRFHTVHVDLVGPLPSSRGFQYLLTMVDRFIRRPEDNLSKGSC